jgi:hypothetical protein
MTIWNKAALGLAMALLFGGCTNNHEAGNATAGSAPVAAAPVDTAAPDPDLPPADAPAPGSAMPPPSIAVGEPNPGAPGVVDASCKVDADCAIKDVGSCCGYRPQCVNSASPTFPDQVKAACADSGRMGICGFPAITGCKCNAGQCEGTGADADEPVQ